jgi:transposase
MSKHFRPWNIDQTLLLPPNVRDFVPKDHISRFIVGLVRDSLDLKAIMGSYVSGLGHPPFDPRMMVSLLLHGYASGLYSSRRIARACCERPKVLETRPASTLIPILTLSNPWLPSRGVRWT